MATRTERALKRQADQMAIQNKLLNKQVEELKAKLGKYEELKAKVRRTTGVHQPYVQSEESGSDTECETELDVTVAPAMTQATEPVALIDFVHNASAMTQDTEPVASAMASMTQDTEPVASAMASMTQDTEPVASAMASNCQDTEPVASAMASNSQDTEPYSDTESEPDAASEAPADLRGPGTVAPAEDNDECVLNDSDYNCTSSEEE
jgi:hypothetical protein